MLVNLGDFSEPVIGYFVSYQSTRFVAGDFRWRVALVSRTQQHRDAIANLRQGDRWGRFFSTAAKLTGRDSWIWVGFATP